MDWWHMPVWLLRCYIDQLPVIQAEEALTLIPTLQAGSPSQSEEEAESKSDIVKAYKEQADPDGSKRKAERKQRAKEEEIRRRLGGPFYAQQMMSGLQVIKG